MTENEQPDRYRILAIDYGTKRIGIALSDELRMLATPRGVIENRPSAINEIAALAKREQVRVALLGIPRTLGNEDSAMTREVRTFETKLREQLERQGVQLLARDERLTSVMANANIAQRGLPKHKRENKALRDEEAARILLQEYLDEQSFRALR